MGGPFDGKYRNASVLHDVAYDQHIRPWEQCDRMFYNAMRCSGVSGVEAKTMYFALYRFGRHWKRPGAFAGAVARSGEIVPRALPVNESELNETRDWIRSADPSLAQIEQRADSAQR
jgi:endonuclease G, mitochondrial